MRPDQAKMYERLDRNAKLARTYMRKVENLMYAAEHAEVPIPTTYWDLLDQALDLACALLESKVALPESYFVDTQSEDFFDLGITKINLSDSVVERVVNVEAALRERRSAGQLARRIALLENVEGRTPAEAEAFLAKARELRERT